MAETTLECQAAHLHLAVTALHVVMSLSIQTSLHIVLTDDLIAFKYALCIQQSFVSTS